MSGLSASESFRYRAYISYSHHDEKCAVWLHKKLESYLVPRRLVGREMASGIIPRRIAPVFRDREELPSATDLGKTVNKALHDSANLVVICSPHAAESRWVNEEVLTFKRLGRSDRIFCFIIAGEPNATETPGCNSDECFPIGLRFCMSDEGILTDQPTEPIAADARPGKDGTAGAKLKLIAGIIGVGFDELRQRELHRRHYRMVAVTATALSIMVLTTILAVRAIVAEEEAMRHRARAEGLITFMLGDLREKLEPIGRLDVLDAVGDEATAYFESLDEDDLTPEALDVRSKAMRQIGEVRMAQGRLDPAIDAFQRSLSDAALLVQHDPGNNEAQFLLAQANFWIGYAHLEQGGLDRSLHYLDEYFVISKLLVDREPEHEAWLSELGYAYTNLGVVFISQGATAKALEEFLGAQAIGRKLVQKNPDDLGRWFDLAEQTSWVGSARSLLGDLNGALEQFREEVTIKNSLVAKDPQNTTWKRRLSLGHRRVGETLEAQGKFHEAIASFGTALGISAQLSALDPANANWQRDLGLLHAAAGRIALAFDNPEEAIIEFTRYARIIEDLFATDPSKVRWQRDLADSRILTGIALTASGDLHNAESAIKAAIEILTDLGSEHPDDLMTVRSLSTAYLIEGQLIALTGNDEEAQKAWLASLELIEPLAQDTKDHKILNIWAQALLCLGRSEEASPIVEQLVTTGFVNSAYAGSCDRNGFSARATN
ncbi:MAG: TIR domain-containing protein [Gammaproteobacteria bacterium]|nr:TIR domain-containing protein [Gammaproteobacteria bacterium]